ncbi:hypothetical protein [Profundibacterium mesophilum]|uniref:TPR domain protein n=1 Tax=Profundibacterium mesophilum KAUST100406-0324 TaxID=1037889 RepID=A0A921TBR3_9RHOB|nr:hypothetical protein [Profundibacterium mesophilum]KAF0674698.1 TPR domain protein [Profundibacterium mesophilum KAUST100406-0324]
MSVRARIAAGALAGLFLLAISVLLGGGAPLGRVLMAVGTPHLAAPLFGQDEWRGAALYRAGRFAQATEAWRADDGLNLGNALAAQGRYAAALEAFDVARAGGDMEAARNFDLLAAFYAGLEIDPGAVAVFGRPDEAGARAEASIGKGNGRAASSGDGATNRGALLGLPELESRGQTGVRKVFDARFVRADERWLDTLDDVPGRYLDARIAYERKRRLAGGQEGRP